MARAQRPSSPTLGGTWADRLAWITDRALMLLSLLSVLLLFILVIAPIPIALLALRPGTAASVTRPTLSILAGVVFFAGVGLSSVALLRVDDSDTGRRENAGSRRGG